MFKLIYVQTYLCSNLFMFKLIYVQTYLCYANDICLISVSSVGMQQL